MRPLAAAASGHMPPGDAATSTATITDEEMMIVAAARALPDRAVCFVGIGLPSAAANLARWTHAPRLVLIYEAGAIGAKPTLLPLSIGDGELAETADTVVSVPEIFRYWLQGGRIDIGFVGAAQIDRYANINTTVIGEYRKPRVRLPGAGGAPEIAACAAEVFVMVRHRRRSFVDHLDFRTSVGHAEGEDSRARLGLPGAGPTLVITDLGLLRPHPESRELVLSSLHPGKTLEQVRASTGWQLAVADDLGTTPPPTGKELEALRGLRGRTEASHRVSRRPSAGSGKS